MENKDGLTLLHIAASKGYSEITSCLLAHGASMVKRDRKGRTAAQMASQKTQKIFNKYKDYKKIITSCATDMGSLLPSKRYEDQDTALHIMAAFSNTSQHIQTLIKTGSNINALNGSAQTPLMVAVRCGNATNVSSLLSHCSSKSTLQCTGEPGKTPLHVAAQNNDIDCITALLKHGAPVNMKDGNGDTALTYLIKHQSREGVVLLSEYGCDFTMTFHNDNTALHLATMANNVDIVSFIVSLAPELVNRVNAGGDSPLSLAVVGNSYTICKLFLECGADKMRENDKGFSAYSMAKERGCDRLVELFS